MTISPDGHWRWDGEQWVPTTLPPLAPAGRTKNRGRGWLIALAVVVGLVVFGALSEGDDGSAPRAFSASTTPKPHLVLYEVEGTSTVADITYKTPTGTAQQEGIDVPMKKASATVTGMRLTFQSGDFVSISAQRRDDFPGGPDLTCRISVDGVVLSENTARGGYSIASCSASVP